MGAIGGFFTPYFPVFQALTANSSSGTVQSAIQLVVSGEALHYAGDPQSPVTTILTRQWCFPHGGIFTPGNFFDVFVSLVSGTLDIGNAGLNMWLDLGIFGPTYGIERTGLGTKEATITLAIRNRTTLKTVASGTVELDIL